MSTSENKPVSEPTAETLRVPVSESLKSGALIGEFRVLSELGRGGMGVVYLAHDEKLDRDVALKVLTTVPHLGAEYETRFLREARSAARLDHPNVVQVYSAGRVDQTSYIAMQFVKGRTLHELQKERGSLEPKEALRVVRDVCRALVAAHGIGIVHRDMKPSNIMIDDNGTAKIMDFGLSRGISACAAEKITQSGIYLGTPEYSSPEQCETNEIDGRSDIYSLGVVLYEALSGRVPHAAPTPLSLFKKILEEEPKSILELVPGLSKSIAALLAKMMAKDPARRYSTAAEVIDDVDKILADRPPDALAAFRARGTSVLDRPDRPAPKLVVAAALVLVAVIAAFALSPLLFPGRKTADRGKTGPEPVSPPVVAKTDTTNIDAVATEPISVVVFDFRNTTGSQEFGWMELGIPEMLINRMNQSGTFKVVTRDEFVLKMREIAGRKIILSGDSVVEAGSRMNLTPDTRRLLGCFNAGLVVCGSFIVQGEKVKIIAETYTVSDGPRPGEQKCEPNLQHVASRDVQGDVADIFALVDSLAVEAMKAMTPASTAKPDLLPAPAPQARVRENEELLGSELLTAGRPSVRVLAEITSRRGRSLRHAGKVAGYCTDGTEIDEKEKRLKKPAEVPVAGENKTAPDSVAASCDLSLDKSEDALPDRRQKGGSERIGGDQDADSFEVQQVLVVKEADPGKDLDVGAVSEGARVVAQLKRLSDKELLQLARVRWRLVKLIEDAESLDAPEIIRAVEVLSSIESATDLESVLKKVLELEEQK
ncbi:MAG: serine/threonine-protein kinase [Planctomycetota bacterium]|nr:serine/threonine-protein kinase [Planctomycetota bacterium]